MFCSSCGSKLEDGTKFCGTCGAPAGKKIAIESAVAPTHSMTSLKVLSIIGIIFAVICFLCAAGLINSDAVAAAGWGIYGEVYLLALSIVALVKSGSQRTKALRALSIIGIIVAALCFFFEVILLSSNSNFDAAGWGFYTYIYLLIFSIVALVKSGKK